jgi:hypothetical protein
MAQTWIRIVHDVLHYPSPHNSQPIKLRPVNETTAEIYYDLDLGLPAENAGIPFGHVCAGVFLESLRVVAEGHGFTTTENLNHDEMNYDSRNRLHHLGTITLTPAPATAVEEKQLKLFLSRQTSRRPYNSELVPDDVISRVEAVASAHNYTFRTTADPVLVKKIVHINQRTLFSDLQNDAVYGELMTWLRFSKKDAAERGDGLSAEAMLMPGPVLQFAMKNRGLWSAPVVGNTIRRVYLNTMTGVSQVGWMEGKFENPADYIEAGRTFMKVWLELTAHNVYLHPFGTVVTNPESHAAFASEVGADETNGRIAWMLFRFGYSKKPPLAHRRPAESMLIGTKS